MTSDNDQSPSDVGELVLIPSDPVRCPKRLTLPAQFDTEGRCWPAGGLQRVTTLCLKDLLDAGVSVRWQLPDGDIIAEDVGRMLVAARQADADAGVRPIFTVPSEGAKT